MIHLQRNFEDAPGNEYDPAHSLRIPNGLRIHLEGRYADNHQRNEAEKIAQFPK